MASSITGNVPGTPQTQRPVETTDAAPASSTRDGITRRETIPANQESVTRADAPPPPPAGAQRGQTVDISA